jgi:hypothetical protein
MKQTRPFRDKEIYAAPCLGCSEEIESETLPIPRLCHKCKSNDQTFDPTEAKAAKSIP